MSIEGEKHFGLQTLERAEKIETKQALSQSLSDDLGHIQDESLAAVLREYQRQITTPPREMWGGEAVAESTRVARIIHDLRQSVAALTG